MGSPVQQNAAQERWIYLGTLALLALGIALRLWTLAENLPLWDDEGRLALNIAPRAFFDLGPPFIGEQIAPLGYMAAVKIIGSTVGWHDWAIRLVSFGSSIGVLFVLWALARRITTPLGALFIVGIAALSPWSIRYGAELKPYATDEFVTALGLYVGLRLVTDKTTLKSSLPMAVVMGATAWFSLPSIFILGGTGATILLHDIKNRVGKDRVLRAAIIGAFWLICFVIHFKLVVQPSGMTESEGAHAHYAAGFAPFPPTSLAELRWYPGKFFYFFRTPGGLEGRYLVGLLFVLGLLSLARRNLVRAVLLAMPLALALGASMAHKYPLEAQLLLFALPCMFTGLGLGLTELTRRKGPIMWLTLAVAGVLIFVRTASNEAVMIEVEHDRNLRDSVAVYLEQRKPGDPIFVEKVEMTFGYYIWKGGLPYDDYITIPDLRDDWDERGRFPRMPLIAEPLFGKSRVWFLLPGSAPAVRLDHWRETNEPLDDFILRYVERCGGKQLARFEGSEAHLSLYDLSDAKLLPGELKYKNPKRGVDLVPTSTTSN